MRWWSTFGLLIVLLKLTAPISAQVMVPMELADPKAQHLQQRHLQTLMTIGKEIEAHKFAYPFYFSRVLDVDLSTMQAADQRSIRFGSYKNQPVLEVTGNYYASYSADKLDSYARLKETFQQVITPILQAEAPRFPDDSEFSAFAVEVSHHVRQKVLGIASETPENVMVIFPISAAQKFVDAKTDDEKEAAVLQAEVFLNAQPYYLWLREGAPSDDWKERTMPKADVRLQTIAGNSLAAAASAGTPSVSASLVKSSPMRIISPETLAGLQRQNQGAVDRLVSRLNPEAHFVAYSAPTFIAFRQASYLQLPIRTALTIPPTSSRYKAAALAFDEHISHLVRPVLDYFPAPADFDGVDFSSTIYFADGSTSEAVEFFLPYRMMQCFATYDCTGQQLLESRSVVINGERASLDLEVAEGKN